jgi:hypothetical protein
MKANKIKNLLDFIPFIILVISALFLLYKILTSNIVLSFEHYIGLLFLLIITGLFIKKHKLGVLALGLTIFLGLIKLISFSPYITFYSFGGSLNDQNLGDLKIQGIFILWLILHIVLSGRHYYGILTKKYWHDLLN